MLYDKLREIKDKNRISFHMPGSKGGLAIEEKYRGDIFGIDFTELFDTDNLANPTGIIKKAQGNAAKIYGANETFFLVNGSSGGILATLGFLAKKTGKIIFDRNCHVSVMNGIKLFDITPVFIMPEILEDWGISGEISPQKLEKLILENPDAGAVFLTSPNYYGISSDLKKIYKICQKYNVLLCVDSAHGAHFKFCDGMISASEYSDISIMSVHKTMPAPTQTAIMNISPKIDSSEMKRQINIFQTTSPSYIFMAFIDYAINFMHENGKNIFKCILKETEKMKSVLGENMLTGKNKDFSRIVIKGGYALESFLEEKYNIAVEMADMHNIVCIAGYGNTSDDFKRLTEGVTEFYAKNGNHFPKPPVCYFKNPEFCENHGENRILLPLIETDGFIAATTVIPYPPGVPLIIEGEKITKTEIDAIKMILEEGGKIIGLEKDQKICVFDKI